MLFLSESEMIKSGALDMKMCLSAVEEMYRLIQRGDYIMGGPTHNEHGIRLSFPTVSAFPNMPLDGPDRRFMAMPAYVGGRYNVCGCKWYGSNRKNLEKNLPRSNHLITVNDSVTGMPICVMVGNIVSAMRTGAVPSIAAKYLASDSAQVVGLVGAGVINRATLMGMVQTVPNLKQTKVYDIDLARGQAFAKEMSQSLDTCVEAVNSLEELVVGSDIVHVAASGKIPPHLKTEWVKEGALICLSAGGKFDDDFLFGANLVIDNYAMHDVWYDTDRIDVPSFEVVRLVREGKLKREDVINLGAVVEGNAASRVKNGKPTIFNAQGMPVYDVSFAYDIYQRALAGGHGVKLELWDHPYCSLKIY